MALFRNASSRPRNRNRTRLSVETLEGRQLLSLGAEFSAPINTTTRNGQFGSASAGSANGSFVAVWVDTFSANDHDIRAQRLDAHGNKVGPEILVSGSSLDEDEPSVAIDGQGDFVVAWRQTLGTGDTNVVDRKFNSSGAPIGATVPVGIGTFAESDPHVAMDNAGDFVVAYTRNTNNSNPDVFAKRYDTNLNLTNVISVATTFRAETHPSVAMTPDGRFDVAWEEAFSAADHDIKLKQYNAAGGLLRSNSIASSTVNETRPSVSIDNQGNAVVAWQRAVLNDFDIQARRISSSGFLGSTNHVASTTDQEQNPIVALKRTGGGFVVSYDRTSSSTRQVMAAEVSASDVVTALSAGVRSGASVSINGSGKYLLTFTSLDAGDANIRGRLGQI